MLSVDPLAARLCYDTKDTIPVELVCLALERGLLIGVPSLWTRWKVQCSLYGTLKDRDLLLKVRVEFNYPG